MTDRDEIDWRKMKAIELRGRVARDEPGAKAEQRRRLSCLRGAFIPAWELTRRPKLRSEIQAAVRASR